MPFRFVFFLFTLTVGWNAQAWREGNGGDVVLSEKGVYLLDLVENGSETLGEANPACPNSFLAKEVDAWGKTLPLSIPLEIIKSKLCSIYAQNPIIALTLAMGFQRLQWQWVSVPLRELDDEGTNVKIPRSQLVQAGLRVNQTVLLQRDLWLKLDERNQAALLFHEVFYALMLPNRNNAGIDMNSPRVRRLVGFIFSTELQQSRLDSVLATEAPHLNWTSLPNSNPAPFWDFERSQLLLFPQWYIEIKTTNGENWRAEVGGQTPSEKWLKIVCKQALGEGSALVLGFEVTPLNVLRTQMGSDLSEEFFLRAHWDSQPINFSVNVEPSANVNHCLKSVAAEISKIQFAVRTKTVRTN